MRTVSKEECISALKPCDAVVCRGNGVSQKAQNLDRMAEGISDHKASHGLFMKEGNAISEADGRYINGQNKIDRYFTDHHKIWVFRSMKATPAQIAQVRLGITHYEDACGVYSWGGIWERVKQTVTKWLIWCKIKKTPYETKDQPGNFCTEYTSRLIQEAQIPYSKLPPYRITPSVQLDYFMDEGVPAGDWTLVAFYDEGDFYLP